MNKKVIGIVAVILGIGLFGLFLFFNSQITYGKIAKSPTPIPSGTFEVYDFFNATTTSATSTNVSNGGYLNVTGAKKVTFYFGRTGYLGNAGTSTFTVQTALTNSGTSTDWITYNKLIDNVTNSNSGTLTRVGSVSLSGSANIGVATGTKMYSMDLTTDSMYLVRCNVWEVVDGEHYCSAMVEW